MTERFIGLDVGSKRIGVAVSDPLQIIGQALKTISRCPQQQSIEEIEILCKEYNVLTVILGLPKNMNGTIGPQAEDVQLYAKLLEEKLQVKVVFEDERLTSKQAEQILISQNKKPFEHKGLIDMTSAAIILQQFLDRSHAKNARIESL